MNGYKVGYKADPNDQGPSRKKPTFGVFSGNPHVSIFNERGGWKRLEREREYGKDTGEDEGGGVRAVAVPTEGDAWSLEGSPFQDPPQSLRELDQHHPPPHPSRRYLHWYVQQFKEREKMEHRY
ncbi:unnamed protein product [Camellia sinensis]